ncbi:NUDIX domain-containing protein [Lactobacillus sp. CC-MHH1034]|uniref:bis(5'-nucleosyl)-tetraphosphatase n=1 Tax=Agrilactobacillus fermenti TaxID=2586909 RepID=UPI001E388D1D|nr:NUDIX domain-containing protein [Agrilactobacillus fermenti]MCD2256794.1 NUDIX domain-containing protein [Agrilactobacillus fermenti]
MKQEVATGAVIYSEDRQGTRQYLLVKSKDRNFWGFAKGHVEAGESYEAAAIREIKEETGLDVQVNTDFAEKITYPLANGAEKVSIFYISHVAQLPKTHKQLSEISDIQWLSYELAYQTLTYDNLKAVLAKAEAYLNQTNHN